mmetsp:Transcript_40385/g.84493  ORF Transcript_40385/g.84493 Transcript_40385/m.84493 type:complete len:285 (+) Transcript_40385:1-855(+)
MRRRGSHSANMLKPTVAVVQEQQQQRHSDDGETRRASDPIFPGMVNGRVSPFQRPPQAQHAQPAAAAPPRNDMRSMQWQPQTQHQSALGQQVSNRHSFASSMDLMSTYTPPSSWISTSQPIQSNLFTSSSHHTSHTAAAGDLLTMSRRAFDPPQPKPNQNNIFAKKRSAAESNGNNTSQINFTNTNGNGSNPQLIGQNHTTAAHPRQQVNAPQHSITFDQIRVPAQNIQGGFYLNNNSSSTFGAAGKVSSSTVDTMADSEDSHQHHRTIRRCRRSDSFEMMEDG